MRPHLARKLSITWIICNNDSAAYIAGWADIRAAYDALDDTMRVRVERLAAHHSLRYSQAKIGHIPKQGSDYGGYGFHNPYR